MKAFYWAERTVLSRFQPIFNRIGRRIFHVVLFIVVNFFYNLNCLFLMSRNPAERQVGQHNDTDIVQLLLIYFLHARCNVLY